MTIPIEVRNEIYGHNGRVYEVGGAVRDSLMGITDHKDHDYIITGIPFSQLIKLLRQFGKVDAVGKSFGVIKLTVNRNTYDIALPRTERSTGEGHRDFTVEADHNMPVEDDLARRDFTMNAIAVELLPDGSQKMIDPFNGVKAIEERRISAVFDEAFAEDPLRMMRAVQFAARFNFQIDDHTKRLIRENATRINTVSPERVFMEIEKLMTRAEYPADAFRIMKSTWLLTEVFPELSDTIGVTQPQKWHDLDVFSHIMAALNAVPSTKLHVRMAALFHDIGKPATRTDENGEIHFYGHDLESAKIAVGVLERWKAPKELIHKVTTLVGNHMFQADFSVTPKAVRRLIAKVGEDLIYDLIDLRIGDRIASGKPLLGMGKVGKLKALVDSELAEPAFSIKNLAINGHDLINAGFKPGPEMGRVLGGLLDKVMDDPSINTRADLLKLAVEM